VLERCYLNETLLDPDEMPIDTEADIIPGEGRPRKPLFVNFAGIPAHYLEPVNDAARAMVAKHPHAVRYVDPIKALHTIGEGGVDVAKHFEQVEARND
jgi:hypothetical protein